MGHMTNVTAQLYPMARQLLRQNAHEQIQTVIHSAAEYSGAWEACLVLLDAQNGIRAAYARSTDSAVETWEPLLNQGLVGYVVHSQRTVIIHDLEHDARWNGGDHVLQHGAAVGLPLTDPDSENSRIFGVLLVMHPQVDYFDAERTALLEALADLASAALPRSLEADDARDQSCFRHAVVPILLTTLTGVIVDVNDEMSEMLGYTPAEVIGLPVMRVYTINTDLILPENMSEMREGEEISFRAVAHTAGGELQAVLMRARRIHNRDGEPLVEFVAHDISVEMEMEQLRTDLTSMIYHDLRNPLNTLRASVRRLAKMLADSDSDVIRTLIDTSMTSTAQLQRMIDSLLDIQRLERGSSILNSRRADLHTMFQEAVAIVRPVAADYGMDIVTEISDSLPPVEVDNDMILRVVTNLLENAVKYTGQDGTITLKSFANEREVVIAIRDSGPGIPYHMQKQIFDKFTRVKYKDAPKGIGLGLAFCKLAIEAHGGQIWVESEPGNGAEFLFTLPLAGETVAPTE